jgi:hypothetical protein
VSIGGIACAAYTSTPPRNAADFLELAENGDFWFRNVSVPFMNPRMGTSLRSRIEIQWIRVCKNCAASLLISVKPGIFYPSIPTSPH